MLTPIPPSHPLNHSCTPTLHLTVTPAATIDHTLATLIIGSHLSSSSPWPYVPDHGHCIPRVPISLAAYPLHLEYTHFRTIALLSKMGVFSMFVVDGEPSELKAWARMERFLKGVDASEVLETVLENRNRLLMRYVRECMELLELLGMPVLEARSKAEALCAQMNNKGPCR